MMGKLGYRSQTVINYLLLGSGCLRCNPHRIFPSGLSLLPNCSQRKTVCGLFDQAFCLSCSVVLSAAAAGAELPGRAPSWFPHCSAAVGPGFYTISLFSVCHSVHVNDFSCVWYPLQNCWSECFIFLDWITSKLSLLITTHRFDREWRRKCGNTHQFELTFSFLLLLLFLFP